MLSQRHFIFWAGVLKLLQCDSIKAVQAILFWIKQIQCSLDQFNCSELLVLILWLHLDENVSPSL